MNVFSSIELLECGRGGYVCSWQVSFDGSGGFEWHYSDIGETGDYRCADGQIEARRHAQDLWDKAGRIDASGLLWYDVAYGYSLVVTP